MIFFKLKLDQVSSRSGELAKSNLLLLINYAEFNKIIILE